MQLRVGVNLTEKSRSREFSWGQSVAARHRAVAQPRCGGEHGRVLGGSGAYGLRVRSAEKGYGTPGFAT